MLYSTKHKKDFIRDLFIWEKEYFFASAVILMRRAFMFTSLFGNIFHSISDLLMSAVITLIALTGHELAHAWVSTKLGDPTPRNTGRLTLNPLAHLDVIGTILMVLTGFGWAKPVMINPMYYKDQRKGMALTAAAGPIANFLMAFVAMFLGIFGSIIMFKLGVQSDAVSWVLRIVQFFVIRNLCFMVFNLIPIPPLDGFKVAGLFLPRNFYYKVLQYEHIIMYVLMALCLFGVFGNVIGTGVNAVYTMILNTVYKFASVML